MITDSYDKSEKLFFIYLDFPQDFLYFYIEMENLNLSDFYTTEEAAKRLKISRQAINEAILREWEGRCKRIGNLWLIPKELVENYQKRKYPKTINRERKK